MNIAIISAYEAQYGGNFLCMLVALGRALRNRQDTPYFIFPEQSPKDYLVKLQEEFEVGYTCKPYTKSAPDLAAMFRKWDIDLVHTHFEHYDIPAAKAIGIVGKDIKMVWHLHDNITLNKDGLNLKFLRKICTHLRFWYHWGWVGRRAYFLPVSQEVAVIENHYRHHFFTFPPEDVSIETLESITLDRGKVVINGIDLSRILPKSPVKHRAEFVEGDDLDASEEFAAPADSSLFTLHSSLKKGGFTFLTFGGHTIRKGIPTILDAAELLSSEGFHFVLNITKGVGTEDYITDRYKTHGMPEWLNLINQAENVIQLYQEADCFISASQKETMSMAVAEASICGLPVIQSHIPGTMWNEDTPSCFTFQVNDATTLAMQMKKVMTIPADEMQLMCKQSSEINTQRLSLETWCENVMKAYDNNG